MPGAGSADGVFAIGHDAQYRPVPVLGDQHLQVSGPGGAGLLLCHSSRPLDFPRRQDGPLVVVVHGALRDSDR